MMKQASLGKKSWREALHHAAYLHNRLSAPILNIMTPIEALLKSDSNNGKLRGFGCAVNVHQNKKERGSRLQDRSTKGIYIGDDNGQYRNY